MSIRPFRDIQRKLTDLNYNGAEIDDNVGQSVSKCTKQNTDSSVKNPRIIE